MVGEVGEGRQDAWSGSQYLYWGFLVDLGCVVAVARSSESSGRRR